MKALEITNKSITRESLLKMAEKIPGAWIGLRIAAMILILEGWKSTQVASLFDVSRWSVVKWIQKVNDQGIQGIEEGQRSGRPSRMNKEIEKDLEDALSRDPREFGLKRNRWDGIVVVEYIERVHGVKIKVRQAQRWIKRLGFSLKMPIYKYAQATDEGVEAFGKTLKKTSAD